MTATAGRPRSFDRQQVLDNALELFWVNGYRATTTRELEQTLGLSQSSIYNAFGSKQGLLMAALATYEDRISETLVMPLETDPDGLTAITTFFDALADWVTHDGHRGCMIINLMAEDAGTDDEITDRTRAYRSRLKQALQDALDRAGVADSEARSDVLYGLVLGLNIAARGGGFESEITRLVDSARAVVGSW